MFDEMVNAEKNSDKFDVFMGDVEELNRKAFSGELDITKLSFHAWMHLSDTYQLLTSGSALGKNCGPLLISKNPVNSDLGQWIQGKKIAIPGKYTTANLLLSIAFPQPFEKVEMIFSDIENAVLGGKVDAGLIIHENRFTYASKGLHKLIDLGEFWESTFHHPIPLGGIAVKRSLPEEVKKSINEQLKRSIHSAFSSPEVSDFVKEHAQEMEEQVMRQHIALYVNDYSKELGKEGKEAISFLIKRSTELGIISKMVTEPYFVE